MRAPSFGRLRRHIAGLVAAVAAVVALGLTAALTLGGFSASIGDTAGTFGSATVMFTETGQTTCYSNSTNAASGSVSSTANNSCTIDMLGASTANTPGGGTVSYTTTVTNSGNHNPSTANLAVGTCTATGVTTIYGNDTGSFCSHVDVTIYNTTTNKCMYPYSASTGLCPALSNTYNLSTLASQTFDVGAGTPGTPSNTQYGLSLPTGSTAQTYTIITQLDSGVALNTDQGLQASLPFTWSISQ